MYKNELLSSIGLQFTQNVIGTAIGGFVGYKIMTHFGGKPTTTFNKSLVVAGVIITAFIFSSIQQKIEQPKFKM